MFHLHHRYEHGGRDCPARVAGATRGYSFTDATAASIIITSRIRGGTLGCPSPSAHVKQPAVSGWLLAQARRSAWRATSG